MRTHMLLVPLLACLMAADDPKDVTKTELKKFEGIWRLTAQTRDGQKVAAEAFEKVRNVYSADGRFSTWVGEKVVQRTSFTVDPTKKPKTFDATIADGEVKGKSLKGTKIFGIYEFDGDTRKICYIVGGTEKDRPTEFVSKPGSGHYLEVQRRAKERRRDSRQRSRQFPGPPMHWRRGRRSAAILHAAANGCVRWARHACLAG
ncbi:MAG: TIGR03067 domain-containing protein [Gemmataceae bacterium]|nr:TIGR03067 domain-containing protein [Gemmataceae bacterium]